MAAAKGPTLRVKKGDGGGPEVFTTIAGARSKTLTINNNPIDITSDDDIDASGVSWRNRGLTGIVDFSVSLSAVLKDVTSKNALIADAIAGTVTNYQLEFSAADDGGIFEGPMIVTNMSIGAELEDALTLSFDLVAAGEVTYTP